jgi:hypothetical protein
MAIISGCSAMAWSAMNLCALQVGSALRRAAIGLTRHTGYVRHTSSASFPMATQIHTDQSNG